MKPENVFLLIGVICLIAGITMDTLNLIPAWVQTIFAGMAILFLVMAFVFEAAKKESQEEDEQ